MYFSKRPNNKNGYILMEIMIIGHFVSMMEISDDCNTLNKNVLINFSIYKAFKYELDIFTLVSAFRSNPLQWLRNERDGVSNHRRFDCLLQRLFRRRSKKTSKLCVTGLCVGNSPVTGEFPTQRASNAENVFIWWCHHAQFWWNVSMDLLGCVIHYQQEWQRV